MSKVLTALFGVLIGVLAACADTVIYRDCGDPGPHEFILPGDFVSVTQSGTPDNGLPISSPGRKVFNVDDGLARLTIAYEDDGASVVEEYRIMNKRSDYE